LKTAVDDAGAERHTVYVFESLELRRAVFAAGEYEQSKWTEVPFGDAPSGEAAEGLRRQRVKRGAGRHSAR
jgi:hypothetical protein